MKQTILSVLLTGTACNFTVHGKTVFTMQNKSEYRV
ncbi:secreted protein [methanotrophic bacterial endosymbiont of Bathymodiolus sp.]|nr:secreted protein [methanotrophic bacterial endosymbiont of Bathymodiolus sp.]